MELLNNLLTGLLSGLAAGWILVKYQAFANTVECARRIIRTVSFDGGLSDHDSLVPRIDMMELAECSAHMRYLGHRHAGVELRRIQEEVQNALEGNTPEECREAFSRQRHEWYMRVQKLKPDWATCIFNGHL